MPRSRPQTVRATLARSPPCRPSSPAAARLAGSVEALFREQSNGQDLVLGVPLRFGLGFGLSSETMPMGPRTCAWGGYGGSLVVNDLDARLTVAYVMNRMEPGVLGDPRGESIVGATVVGLLGG